MFDRSVNEAMQRTVRRLEDIHNFGVVNNMMFSSDTLHWQDDLQDSFDIDFNFENEKELEWLNDHPDSASFFLKRRTNLKKRPVKIIREFSPKEDETLIELKVDGNSKGTSSARSYSYNISTTTNKPGHVIVAGNNTNTNNLVFVRKDSIISDIDSLYTYSTIRIDSVLTELDTFDVLRPDLSKRVQVKAVNLKRMANQMITEVASWDVRQVDKKLVAETLKKELAESSIPLDFDFGIIRDSVAELSEGAKDSTVVVNAKFLVDLYPNDIFQKNIKLAVYFPGKDGFIYRSLNWLLLASFVFSLFILVTFALSIFYILRQKKISEMKSDFINNMTHEFKTPIATISVATDSITNQKVLGDPERIKYFAGMIKKENTRMNRQVEDILTIARLDRKDFEFHWEPIDAHELIKDAVQGITLQIEKRGGLIDLDLKAANSVVTTDKIHCTNVVYNLIDNANKYSPDTPEIKITSKNLSKGILISVSDQGIGMSKAVQAKIFERFYRQTSGNVHNVKGFGLGLSYVKAVIEANRGAISVSSEPGKGSKFDVFLPFVRE